MEKDLKIISEEYVRNIIREELKSFLLNEEIDKSRIKNIVLFSILAMMPNYNFIATANNSFDPTPHKTLEEILNEVGMTEKLANELSYEKIKLSDKQFDSLFIQQQEINKIFNDIKNLEIERQKLLNLVEQATDKKEIADNIKNITDQIDTKNKLISNIIRSGSDEFKENIINTSNVAMKTITTSNKKGIKVTRSNIQQKGIEYLLSPEGRVEVAVNTIDDDLNLIKNKIEQTYNAKFVGLQPLDIASGFVIHDLPKEQNLDIEKTYVLNKVDTLELYYNNPEILSDIGLSQQDLKTFQFFIQNGQTLNQIENYYESKEDSSLDSDKLKNAKDVIEIAISKSQLKENKINKLRIRLNEIRGLYV